MDKMQREKWIGKPFIWLCYDSFQKKGTTNGKFIYCEKIENYSNLSIFYL